jgi:hypothetical protein
MSVTCFYPKKNLNSYSWLLNLHYKELSKLFCIPYSALITRQLLHEWSSMYNSLHCRISIVFGFLAPKNELFPTLGYWRNRHPKVHYNIPYFIPCSRNGPSKSTSNNSTHLAITKVRFMESTIYLLQFSCLFLLIDVIGIHILLLRCGGVTQFYIREMIAHFLTLFTWLLCILWILFFNLYSICTLHWLILLESIYPLYTTVEFGHRVWLFSSILNNSVVVDSSSTTRS